MDLWQLHIFCRVVELKSFSKAGRSVHLSQPTVSSHIKDMETHFGCRLIDRLSREAVPTREGSLLYGYARRMLALKEETESALAEFQGAVRGRLVIGGSTIPGGYLLPKIIGNFSRKYPEVMVSLTVADTRAIVRDILNGQLELGVVGARTADSQIFQERVVRDEMRLIVGREHRWANRKRIDIDRLRKEPFILRESGSGTLKTIIKALSQKGLGIADLKAVAEMGNTVAVIQAIKSRVGVSVLSTIAVAEELASGVLKSLQIEGLSFDRHLYLTRQRHRTPSPLNRTFTHFIKSNFDN